MGRRFCDDVDLIERKLVRILALLGDDDWLNAAKAGDLPVDVQHFPLEKRRTIEGDDRSWTRRVVQCLKSNIERQNQKFIVTSLLPLPFPISRSRTTLSSDFPYWAGAFRFNLWTGFPPRPARGSTP